MSEGDLVEIFIRDPGSGLVDDSISFEDGQ